MSRPIKIRICNDCTIWGKVIEKSTGGIPSKARSIGERCPKSRGEKSVVQIKKDGCTCANAGEFIKISRIKEPWFFQIFKK